MSFRIFVLTLALSLGLGCAKKTDYLYYYNPNRKVAFEHKVKELSGGSGDLDILWVIDNSSSMRIHQSDVIANMSQFIDGLVQNKTLRWKMGLISTTSGERPYVGFRTGDQLDNNSPDAVSRFNNAVSRLGLGGNITEREYDPVIDTLRAFPDFVRPNAYLAIIIVSDAAEQSSRSTAQFITDITAIKGKLSNVLVYDFANPVDWCSPTDDVFNWGGSKIEELLKHVQGGAYKLCDPAFGKNVADLGSVVASQVTSPRIVLRDRPIASSIQVFHGDQLVPGGAKGYWTYEVRTNSIIFNDLSFAPNPNESVRISYEIDGN